MTDDVSQGSAPSRRNMLLGGAGMAAALGLPQMAAAADATAMGAAHTGKMLPDSSNILTLRDGATMFYKDWGSGKPIVFCHGWPLSADAWDAQLLFFGEHGYRVIAHDRRGHARSSQTWNNNNMDTYADDLSELMNHLDLKDAILVGHSTGGGEVARYIGRHGEKRVSKAVLVSAVPPWMAKSDANPHGAPMEVFDQLRSGVRADHSQFYKDLSSPFFGTNRPGAKPYIGLRDSFWLQAMAGGHKSLYDCIKAFSETDFTGDLKKMNVPTLLVQGDDDQIVPIQISSQLTVKIVKNATLKVYPGAPHGLPMTHLDQFNDDLLAFFKS